MAKPEGSGRREYAIITPPGVSFVVTVFNKSAFLAATIASLSAQAGLADTEYIFIDDGSTDGSLDVLKRETATLGNVKIISQANAGPSVATNVGVRAATRPYVKLLDGDDLLAPGATVWMVGIAEETGADIVKGELGAFTAGEPPVWGMALGTGTRHVIDDGLGKVIATGIANTSGTLFRREPFLAAGGCDESIFIQDFSFFLRMAAGGSRIVTVTDVTALVPTTVETRISDMTGQALHDMNRALLNLLRRGGLRDPALRRLAMRRAAGRTWKWARRHRGTTILSRPFLDYVLSRLPFAGMAEGVLERSCRPYRAAAHLRFLD